jgi:hypothetical protein
MIFVYNLKMERFNIKLRDSIRTNFYDEMQTLFNYSLIPELGNSLLDVWDDDLSELFHTIQI